MRTMIATSCLAALGVLALTLPAAAVLPSESDQYEVAFPSDQFTPVHDMSMQNDLAADAPGWQRFTAEMGIDWRAFIWDEANDVPEFAAGEPIPLLPAGTTDEGEVARLTGEFIASIQDLVRVDPADLRFQSVRFFRDRAWVHYEQRYAGLPVFNAHLAIHLWRGGVNGITADVYPDIMISPSPGLSEAEAVVAARAGLPWNTETDAAGEITLGILPVVWDRTVAHFLVYRVSLQTSEPEGRWETYVDANDGEIYWRYNLNSSWTITGNTVSDVQPRRADEPTQVFPAKYQYVEADGNITRTDEEGNFEVTVAANQNYTVTSQNWGDWVRVLDYLDMQVGEMTTVASPSNPAAFHWTDVEEHIAARACYMHANTVHDWIKMLDPTWTGMDNIIFCNVNRVGQTCNANYNGNINFYRAGGGCFNFAQVADVVYHEYSHGITAETYWPSSPPTASGMGEGFSDYTAMAINEDWCMGPSTYTANPNSCMRSGLNTRQWPGSDCGGEVHCLGEMAMGWLWKSRRNLVNKYGPDGGLMGDLFWREAVWAKSYYLPSVVQYYLMANDNNGNLADGTPDYWEICDAAAEHNLTCPLITIYLQFDHIPLMDTANTGDPILVRTDITTVGDAGTIIPDSTKVHFSYDGINYQTAPLANVGGNTWEGFITPAPGVLVDYYIRSVTTLDVAGTEPERAPRVNTHRFLIGATEEVLTDDFETNQGWTFGAPDDNATNGLWERADPVGKEYNGEWIQPEDDHTPAGTECLVTDGQGGMWFHYNVDGGKTSVISPPQNMFGGGPGYIEFYGFLCNAGPVNDDSLMVYASGDGTEWTMLWQIDGEGYNDPNYWYEKIYFRPTDFEYTQTVQFKFVVEDNENNTVTEAAIDDVVVRAILDLSAVEPEGAAKLSFGADPPSPSVFAKETAIHYQIPVRQAVHLRIMDVNGRVVRTLAAGAEEAGEHVARWDGRTDGGHAAPSGIYYYQLLTGGREVTHKIVLAR